MSFTVEQETDDMIHVEAASAIESNESQDEVTKETGIEAVNSRSEAIDARELKAILEAILFVSPEPVPVARLMSIVGTASKVDIVQALGILTHDLDQDGRGFSWCRSQAGIGW